MFRRATPPAMDVMSSSPTKPFAVGDRIVTIEATPRRGTIVAKVDKISVDGALIWYELKLDIRVTVTFPGEWIRYAPAVDQLAELIR